MNDDFFNYLVATDQLDDFLGFKGNEDDLKNKDDFDNIDDLDQEDQEDLDDPDQEEDS